MPVRLWLTASIIACFTLPAFADRSERADADPAKDEPVRPAATASPRLSVGHRGRVGAGRTLPLEVRLRRMDISVGQRKQLQQLIRERYAAFAARAEKATAMRRRAVEALKAGDEAKAQSLAVELGEHLKKPIPSETDLLKQVLTAEQLARINGSPEFQARQSAAPGRMRDRVKQRLRRR
ncbi:MAG: hypothetical protein WD294_03095 [Phycisphaeraceae bacterium]